MRERFECGASERYETEASYPRVQDGTSGKSDSGGGGRASQSSSLNNNDFWRGCLRHFYLQFVYLGSFTSFLNQY